ncbi:MAG: potassium channel protein [Gaiellales bacterium]|nr:MAG: potassium channel protein [Gaiellales bacterium]
MQWQSIISPKRILFFAGVLITLGLIGTVGFMMLEELSVLDALYMTVVLISTVGIGMSPETAAGKILAIMVIAIGVGTLFYAFGTFIEFLIGGYLADLLEERSMKKKISEYSGHYVICGFGRVGEQVAKEFQRSGKEFIIIDSNPESISHCREHGYPYVEGDAAEDDVLNAARLTQAEGLVACVDSDADNVFVTLSARVLAPEITIVSRGNTEESYSKLVKAGADKVVSPYAIGGREMATLMLKPMVSDYLDIVTGGGQLELRVEQLKLACESPILGQSIQDLQVRQKTGSTILAIRKPGGAFDTNPSPSTVLEENDVVIAAGTHDEIRALEQMVCTPGES